MICRCLALLAVVAGGCSGGGDRDGTVTCAFEDLCVQVPLARVAATCATTAATATYAVMPGGPDALDLCTYAGPSGTVFEIDRSCSPVAGDALLYYQAAYDNPLPLDFVREDVGGLGDRAFIRGSAQTMRAQLFVLRGNLLFNLQDYEAPDAAAVKTCLTTLAADVLAAR